MIKEEALDIDILTKKIYELYEHRSDYVKTMEQSGQMNAIPKIMDLILELCDTE